MLYRSSYLVIFQDVDQVHYPRCLTLEAFVNQLDEPVVSFVVGLLYLHGVLLPCAG